MANILLKPVLSLVSSAERESCRTDVPGCGVPIAISRSVSSFSSKGPSTSREFSNYDFQGPTIKE